MIKKLLAKIGLGAQTIAATRNDTSTTSHQPYGESHANFLYNLLFCDDLELFRNDQTASGAPWETLLADSPEPEALQKIAKDEAEESRLRVIAFNRLRQLGAPVPPKNLLGTIVEFPVAGGLDTLAAYSDGRVRYLNHSGKVAIFEGAPAEVESLAKEVIVVSQPLLNQIGPWDKKRLPPPKGDAVRITFLVSDGLYFGQGPSAAMLQDPIGGRVLSKATQLLLAVTKAGTKQP